MAKHRLLTALSIILLLATSACANRDSEGADDTNGGVAAQAAGWSDLKMVTQISEIRGGAEVHVSPFGHFTVKPNACWQEASSPIMLNVWNQIVSALNSISTDTVSDNETCFAAATTNDRFDGAAEMKLPSGKTMEILNNRGGANGLEICTKLHNVQAAQILARALDQMLPAAAYAGGCVTH